MMIVIWTASANSSKNSFRRSSPTASLPSTSHFFIASCPETLIDNLFTHACLSASTNRIFLEPSPEDVGEFLTAEFEEVNRCYPNLKAKYSGKWPRDGQLERLAENSSGYFIICATAMRYINPPMLQGRPPDQRMDDVMDAVLPRIPSGPHSMPYTCLYYSVNTHQSLQHSLKNGRELSP